MQISPIKNQNVENRLLTYLIGPKWRFWEKNFFGYRISQKKFGSAYAQSPRKCSNIEILVKIEGKEAKFFSKIYEGHIRIWFRSNKNSKLSHACVPLTQMSSSNKKNWHVKEFIRVYRLKIQSVMLVFRPSFVNCCPFNLLYGSTLPLHPLPCVSKYTVYTYSVCKGGGVRGSGPQTDKHLLQSPFTGQIF